VVLESRTEVDCGCDWFLQVRRERNRDVDGRLPPAAVRRRSRLGV